MNKIEVLTQEKVKTYTKFDITPDKAGMLLEVTHVDSTWGTIDPNDSTFIGEIVMITNQKSYPLISLRDGNLWQNIDECEFKEIKHSIQIN